MQSRKIFVLCAREICVCTLALERSIVCVALCAFLEHLKCLGWLPCNVCVCNDKVGC